MQHFPVVCGCLATHTLLTLNSCYVTFKDSGIIAHPLLTPLLHVHDHLSYSGDSILLPTPKDWGKWLSEHKVLKTLPCIKPRVDLQKRLRTFNP